MYDIKLTFLGTGTSTGVPVIGCTCPTCTSADRRDIRYRCSVLLNYSDGTGTPYSILVDCTPEFRLQALRHNIERIDAVFLTHSHADHIFGLDDLRRYNQIQKAAIPIFGNRETLHDIHRIFKYVFVETQKGGGKPRFNLSELRPQPLHIGPCMITPIPIKHGELDILGYRFDIDGSSIGYITDCSSIPPDSLALLAGLDFLIIGALRHKPHTTHMTLAQAAEVSQSLSPGKTYFTHIAHDITYAVDNAALPKGISLSYDGLIIEN